MNRPISFTLVCLLHASLGFASTFNLNVEVTPSGSGSLNTTGGTYEEGSKVNLRTSGYTGFAFKGWYESDSLISSSTNFSYIMPSNDVLVQARYEYDPTVPSNPAMPDTTTYYALTATVSPIGAGTLNTYSGKYAANATVKLRTYGNTGYQFVGWQNEEGETLSSSTSFNYTMPRHNSQLTALYVYDPSVPANPDSMSTSYTVNVACKPVGGGTFNTTSATAEEGGNVRLYAYTNTGYRFLRWENETGETISTAQNFYYIIPHGDSKVYGIFEYDPAVPDNPNKNFWNKTTGEVIVDDFTPGSLNNAIYYALNRDNSSSDEVTMITVAGKMNSNDFGIANNYYNCTLLDLSRTYGYTDVPSYAYDYNTSLQHIILPAGVENIGYRAFDQCSNLSQLTCYAITPPVVGSNAFRGIAEGAVLHVLSAAIPLYAEADGWKDFTILPLTEEVRTLEVNLPAGSEDGRYKNMTLELVNAESGHKQKYVISDRISYTFSGLLKKSLFNVYVRNSLGFVLGQLDNIAIEDEDVSVTFESLLQPQDVTLSVLTAEGENVTAQVQSTWFDAATNTYLSRGNTIKGVTEGTRLTLRVTLPQTLGMAYVAPTDTLYTVLGSNNNVNITLNALPQVTISGTVKDVTTGNTISNAVVSVSQTLNGKYSKAFTAKTDNKGVYSLTVYNAPSTLTFSCADYISQTASFEDFTTATELGTVSLKSITGATITTSFTYRTSVEEGATPDIQNWYSDYANIAYSIYNKTQQKAIHDFNVQYPSIVLLEEVAEGDELQFTATSKNGAFVPVEATAVIDASNRAEAIFDIMALGGIRASFTSTDNSAVVGILYDAKGQLIKKYNYSSATITINDLQDGRYTLVSMGSSTLFNSIYNLSQLPSTGLKEGNDYVVNTVAVESGLIATINNNLIPKLDESKLYYTGSNTMFSVNKTSVTAGNYLTLKGKIDFKDVYASKVSNVNMVIDLPESAEFVENSVMVGTNISSYTLDGNRLTIPLERYTDQVRFCIIPTAGGDYAPNAFAQFIIDDKEVLQPIGSAHYIIKDLSINVPSTVAKTTIPISGTSLGSSTIQIYDNDVLIGETTSLANGVWSTTCELDEPYNLSTHSIYAKVKTKAGLELISETQQVVYDINMIVPEKVTMLYYNPEYVGQYNIVFDLINGTVSPKFYYFFPYKSYPNWSGSGTEPKEFTFIADLSNNDSTAVNGVTIRVYTDNGYWRNLEAQYNTSMNRWVAVSQFLEEEAPVGVDVMLNVISKEIVQDRDYLTELLGQVDVNISNTSKEIESISSILTSESYMDLKETYDELYNVLSDSLLDVEKLDDLLGIIMDTSKEIDYEDEILDEEINKFYIDDDVLEQEYENSLESICNSYFISRELKDFNLPTDNFSTQLDNGDYKGTYKIEQLDSIDTEQLILNGYNRCSLTDNTDVYFKFAEDEISFVDAKTNIKYTLYLERGTIVNNSRRRISSTFDFENFAGCLSTIKDGTSTLRNFSNNTSDAKIECQRVVDILSLICDGISCFYMSAYGQLQKMLNDVHAQDMAKTNAEIKSLEDLAGQTSSRIIKNETEIKNLNKAQKGIEENCNALSELMNSPSLSESERAYYQNEFNKLDNQRKANNVKIGNLKNSIDSDVKAHQKIIERIGKLNLQKLAKEEGFINATSKLWRMPTRLTRGAVTISKTVSTLGKLAGPLGVLIEAWSLFCDLDEGINEINEWKELIERAQSYFPCEGDSAKLESICNDINSDTKKVIGHALSIFIVESDALALDIASLRGFNIYVWLVSGYLNGYGEISKNFILGNYIQKRGNYYVELMNLKCEKDKCPTCGKDPCVCKDKCSKCGKNPCVCPSPSNTIDVQHDPSGYVYEGVSSNRVEGVMASCYYKETVEDMYGDLHENVVLWDAEQYAQENPLFTDANGMYRWDVPKGLWQVKFEKEGYETTYSDWLPVPPPQLEVNVAIKQNTQPEVKVARAYEDAIEVEFNKYMQPDLLNTENIVVTKNGETATGEVKLLNEEEAYEGKTEKYASKLRFVPEVSFLTTDEVVLTVSRKVKSYAGIQMEADYTQEFDIEKEVKSLVADSLVTVPYGGTKEMVISALPYDAAIGKTLIVKSASSMIATVDADTLQMDENGQATVTLTGELPGTSVVTFALADADVSGMSTVQVVIVEEKVTANPTASRVSGTAVYRGTEVSLNCDTKDAVIYYTLDGSCPCDEATRIEYNGPIVIASDSITLKAMAVADGMYESDVVEFHYTLKKTTLCMSLNEGWNWVSHNVETPIAASELQKNATRIVSQTEELVNDPAYGLIGNLDSISPTEAYKVQVSENTEYALTGYEYNAATTIAVCAGWNWLGYPVNQVMSVNEAFANATPTEGDYIVGQDGFALYNDGVWTGTLLTLNPGDGYLYQAKTAYEFAYNTSIVSKAKALYGKGVANATSWTADKHKYPNVMCVVADLYVANQVTDELSVGAFCGTECRGVGKYICGKLMMSIYGHGGEKITFVAMNNATEEEFSIDEEVVFAETLLGSMEQAYPLHVGEATNIQNTSDGWNVRLDGDNLYLIANSKAFDRVTLTDVYGNVVLATNKVLEGKPICVSALQNGVYIITAEQDGVMYYKKIMKVGK